jgi:hypothetical protein
MNLTRLVPLVLLSLPFTHMSLPTQAQTVSLSVELAQANKQNNSQVLEDKATKMLQLFFAQDFDAVRKMIAPELKEEISPQLLKKEWFSAISNYGSFQKLVKSEVVETPNSNLVIVTIEFQNETNQWMVIFDNNQQIIGTDFPTTQTIENIAIEVFTSLALGKFDNARSYLHPFLKQDIFPQQVESQWKKLQEQNGDFKQIIGTETRRGSSLDNTDLVFVTIKFANKTQDSLIMFDNNKRIIGIDLFED